MSAMTIIPSAVTHIAVAMAGPPISPEKVPSGSIDPVSRSTMHKPPFVRSTPYIRPVL